MTRSDIDGRSMVDWLFGFFILLNINEKRAGVSRSYRQGFYYAKSSKSVPKKLSITQRHSPLVWRCIT